MDGRTNALLLRPLSIKLALDFDLPCAINGWLTLVKAYPAGTGAYNSVIGQT